MAFAGGNGTIENPYQVATAEQLNDIRNYLDSCFIQTADIDLSIYPNWVPIGNDYDNAFKGVYDGQGYHITNLRISTDGSIYNGLFGYANGNYSVSVAIFKNVYIVDAHVESTEYASGILLGSGVCSFSNCHTSGFINGTHMVGGMCGEYYDGDTMGVVSSIVNCTSTATVVGSDSFVGGLFGYMHVLDVRSCSHSVGKVTGKYEVGGFVGCVDSPDSGLLQNCYASGAVESTGDSENNDHLTDCGGFSGSSGNVSYTNCYSACTITNAVVGNNIHAFIGWEVSNYPEDAVLTSCYYDSTLCALANTTAATSKTTEEMKLQVTFVDWDFENVWGIYTDYYPFISGSPDAPEPPAPPEPPTYYDRIVIGGLEVELLNRANIGDAIVLWMNNHKVKTLDFYNNGLNVVYADNTAKSLSYTVDELGQINKISDSSDSSEVNISWHNTEL